MVLNLFMGLLSYNYMKFFMIGVANFTINVNLIVVLIVIHENIYLTVEKEMRF